MGKRTDLLTVAARSVRRARQRGGGRHVVCVGVVAVLAVLRGTVVSAPAAAQGGSDSAEVRIVARKLESGRVEFGLQQRRGDAAWGDRQLPRVRFFPTTATVDRWLARSSLELAVGEVRIVARRLVSGRVEFGLQQRRGDAAWGDRQLPRVRFFPTTAAVGRWLASSSLALVAPPTDGATEDPVGDSPEQGDSPGQVVAVAFGFACGIGADSGIVCWGDESSSGRSDAPSGQFSAVAAGYEHACGIRTDGTVACWGKNDQGQAAAPSGRFVAVTAGGTATEFEDETDT